MMIDDADLIADFVTESREHLATIEGELLAIEATAPQVDVDLVNKVFRGIHSIKGAAGFLGLSTINRLAHSLENVLGKMRAGDLTPTSPIVEAMLRAADALQRLIGDVQHSNEADVSDHILGLDAIYQASAAPLPPEQVEPAEPATCGPAAADELPVASDPEARRPAAGDACPAPATTAAASPVQVESSIRVGVGVLDKLMNLAGELVLGRNQLVQAIGAKSYSGIDAVAARLDQVTSEVQEAIMKTRMQPIGNVFNKFPRVVRDLSAALGKQCEVVMDGKEVEVDKTIIEAIGDPLTHLVRNAMDHGLELPAQRAAQGKALSGTVRLRAYHQAGKVRIDVADDGAGIDPIRLKGKAVAKGVINAEQAARMSDREAVSLIFHPGFSTAEKVTDVSGRGVGMDVVRTNIERLGGSVDVESRLGAGTTIQITLPLTLAIIPSLIVGAGGERFAIPQVNVLELVRIRTDDLEKQLGRINDAEVLRLRGDLLPIVRLNQILRLTGGTPRGERGPVNVVVMEGGQQRYGLVVDEIVDSEEIVVKPLGRHVKTSGCLAGATILGDGHVALILDAAGMVEAAHLARFEAAEDAEHNAHQGAAKDLQDLLLFSNAPGEQFAIPMSLVTRLERTSAEKIEIVGGRRLLQYRGGALPLVRLEDFITTKPAPDEGRLFIIVVRAAGRELGLAVPYVDDIRQLALDVDPLAFREKGVAGAFVLNESTVRLIDVVELAEQAHPEWFAQREEQPKSKEGDAATAILIAEDSAFFRQQIANCLTSKGYEVVGCEDGAQAWQYLTEEPHQVRLVITDIEMPIMDGFALCQRIKSHPHLGQLPVVALTSLASEANIEHGRDVGIDDYQVKMDREQVLASVARLLAGSLPNRDGRRSVERYAQGEFIGA